MRERNWSRVIRKSGLRKRTLYQCRHSYAALQLSRGENPQYVAHQMGHTTLEMIIRHYGRWMRKPETIGRLAEQLDFKFPPSLPEICKKMAESGPSCALFRVAALRPSASQLTRLFSAVILGAFGGLLGLTQNARGFLVTQKHCYQEPICGCTFLHFKQQKI